MQRKVPLLLPPPPPLCFLSPSQLLAPCVPCPQHQQHVIQATILQPPLCTRDTWEHKVIVHTIRQSKAPKISKGDQNLIFTRLSTPPSTYTHDKPHVGGIRTSDLWPIIECFNHLARVSLHICWEIHVIAPEVVRGR